MSKPLVSIVVPTKNRYFYLEKLIALVSGFECIDLIEFVVQDNSDDNTAFLEFLKENEYPFLKYFYNGDSMPISKNSDLAIRNSTGEYVTFIGDDDGITKYIVDCCHWMKKNDVECVVPVGYSYHWPDAISASKLLDSGGTINFKQPSNKINIVSTEDAIKKLQEQGCVNRDVVPLLYHGVVKRSTLDKIWDKCQTYFPGASPDMANAVALSLVMDKFAFVTFPVVYSGASKHLGGKAKQFKHRAVLDFKQLPFLPDNLDEIWDKRIPKIWTGPTIWCESAVEAMNAMGRTDLTDGINYEALYEHFAAYFFYYRKMAYKLSKNKLRLFGGSTKQILSRYINVAHRIISKKFYPLKEEVSTLSNILDINQANNVLFRNISEHNINPFV